MAALMLSLSLCCTAAFAAPAPGSAETGESDALVDIVDGAEVEASAPGDEQTEGETSFGRAYIIKGVVVVGVGVAFYVALSIKSKKK